MEKRQSVWKFVPVGTVIGCAILVVMAFLPPMHLLTIIVSLVVIGYTAIRYLSLLGDAEEKIRALKAPEKQNKVQPLGPSFQEVLRAVPDPVMIVSGHEPYDIAARRVIFANDAAQTVFHLRPDGGPLVGAIRVPEVLENVDEALFGGITGSVDFETSGGARDQFWRAFSAPLPMEKAHDGQRLALLVIRDETDARRMERMRADFLANASHELRTPLASITGFIETLRGPARDDEQARDRFLTIMGAQADRMGRLIADLLSLSRIEMSEHVPPSGEADLALAVRDVVDSLSVLAQQKSVRLRIDAPRPGLFPIIGDRDQILQVVQNLTDNALKYAPQDSEVSITVCFDVTLPQAMSLNDKQAAKLVLLRPDRNVHEYYARVTVRDEGPGIKREFLPRLAERFYRVEGQKSGDKLGTGLGLAIVKHIINRHRGGLVVESQGAISAKEDDILERDGKVASLPPLPPQTFTAFSAYFPQSRAFGAVDAPRLVTSTAAPMKDAG
ncbi:sensor histidine kinase [Asticcacaulis taihuensis]|uniref:sensor histidine kinase n=1 Tax=Asticcacaulis taihuensis TaxID=260084 RepID=UPI0026EA6C36|nr:ATP-binding protein [Asticcacaulis taihuensis]